MLMNPLNSSWNHALNYSRYPAVIPLQRYPIPTVIIAVTTVLPHSPLPCHSLLTAITYCSRKCHGLRLCETTTIISENLMLLKISGCHQRCIISNAQVDAVHTEIGHSNIQNTTVYCIAT